MGKNFHPLHPRQRGTKKDEDITSAMPLQNGIQEITKAEKTCVSVFIQKKEISPFSKRR